MEQAIIVEPSADGWVVRSAHFDNEMFFRSGECAETAARDLGTKLARANVAVVMEIFLRDGSLGGRYACVGGGWRQAPIDGLPADTEGARQAGCRLTLSPFLDGDPHLQRGVGEAAMFPHRHEGREVVQRDPDHS